MTELRYQDYHSVDYDACIAIFDSNCPKYFSAAEKQGFAEFLLDLPGPYLLLYHKDTLVGCGGYAFNPDTRSADLCWGMIHADFHGKGFGDQLLQDRLNRIQLNPDIQSVRLCTSQKTSKFFQRQSFTTLATEKDGFAPGLDNVEMSVVLNRN